MCLIFYNKKDKKYYLLKSTLQDDVDVFVLMNFPEICNARLYIEETTNNDDTTNGPIESTLLSSQTTILSSTILSPSTTILSPPTTILIEPSSSFLHMSSTILISSTTIIEGNSIILSLTTTETKNSFSPNQPILENESLNTIFLYLDGDIMKGKLDKTKEEFENSLDDFMKTIEIGKKYEIYGNDYNVSINPINDIDYLKSSIANFEKCEEILRKEYNMTEEEILTILQIEIDKMNEKALTNQIEYAVYDEDKTKLNLSYCKNVEIKIKYEIKNDSLLNSTMLSYYSDLGIDLFDSNDSFFKDICYPFSIDDSDIILKDRVLIYIKIIHYVMMDVNMMK